MEPTHYFTAEPISVLTYNLLYPQRNGEHADPRSSTVGYRYDADTRKIVENSDIRIGKAVSNILNNLTDVICFQEITPNFFQRFQGALTATHVGVFQRHYPKAAHGIAIFYRSPQFTRLDVFQQKFENRVHLILDLQSTISRKIIRIASCHLLDPRCVRPEHKADQICKILDDMKPEGSDYRISAFVIAGDFNQDQWGDAPPQGKNKQKPEYPHVGYATLFKPLLDLGYMTDQDYSPSEFKRSRPMNKKRNPYQPELYAQKIVPRKRRIDYVWIRTYDHESIQALTLQKIQYAASDHAPVGSVFNV